MIRLKTLNLIQSMDELAAIPAGKVLVNTINAHSYNVARKDPDFAAALLGGDYLIPDGMSVVYACRLLRATSRPVERIAGWDLFEYEMSALAERGGRVMFMGSSPKVLNLIRVRCSEQYPSLEVVTYSPPFKPEFSAEDDDAIISAINDAHPDLLWIGMTAPKQEKWAFSNWDRLDIDCHAGTVGAVFDFFAGTVERAPKKWQDSGFEWLYRLIKEPRRMWRRYILGNAKFIINVISEIFTNEL